MKRDPLAQVIDLAAARTDADAASKLMASLQRSSDGATLPTHANAMIIMAYDPMLRGSVVYNAFTHRALITRPPPRPTEDAKELAGPYPRGWTDTDVVLVTGYVQRVYSSKFKTTTMLDAMMAEAQQRQTHPVVDWLASLKWDATPRLDAWLAKAFGCPDDTYHTAVGAKTLIAAVRRVRQPGCKFDTMLVIEGIQNIGKSSALRRLAGDDWFSDSMPANLESKDSAMALAGWWIIEFAELQHVVRAEVETIKAFLSRAIDRYRPPYGRNVVDVPRQGIVIGTTNESDYLRDTTGNRRFWPIRAQYVELDWISEHRTQLWAEAAAREKSGEAIYLAEADELADAAAQQADRLEQDVWSAPIMTYLAGKVSTTIADVMNECLAIDKARQTRRETLRVAGVLRGAGWNVAIERGYGGVQRPMRVYYAP